MNLLEPWVLVRMVAGAVATLLFGYGAFVGARILRYAHVGSLSEGQLSLERQAELAATLVRVGALVQLVACAISVFAADRLSGSIRGAMCGYGVVEQTGWGWRSISMSVLTGIAAAVFLQVLALDCTVRTLDLMRPLALATLALAPLALVDWALAAAWLTKLDLSAVASCCTTTLDSTRREGLAYASGPRLFMTWGAALFVSLAIATSVFAFRHPTRAPVDAGDRGDPRRGPFGSRRVGARSGPLCVRGTRSSVPVSSLQGRRLFHRLSLVRLDFLATTWGLGALVSSLLATSPGVRQVFPLFAKARMAGQALAWTCALIVGGRRWWPMPWHQRGVRSSDEPARVPLDVGADRRMPRGGAVWHLWNEDRTIVELARLCRQRQRSRALRYAPLCLHCMARSPTRFRGARFREYYSHELLASTELLFVAGSDVVGPMGADLVPVARDKAGKFARDHNGAPPKTTEDLLKEGAP